MSKRTPHLLIWLLSAIGLQTAMAGPASRESLVSLTNAADAIVIGAFVATSANGVLIATVEVERVLKGSPMQGRPIALLWTQPNRPFPPGAGWSSSGHGLLFLRQNQSGSWSLLPTMVGDTSWEDTYIPMPATMPQDLTRVASESLPPSPSAVDRVVLELVIACETGHRLPVDLIALFRERKSPVLAGALPRFLASRDPVLKSVALRGGIVSGDPSSILNIHRNYSQLSAGGRSREMLDEIRFYFLNTDSKAIQVLGQVVSDTTADVDLRIAVAAALARMHTRPGLPYLAALLADESLTLRTMGVGGLASFANNVPIGSHEPAPGPWPYRTDETIAHSAFDEASISAREAYYLSFWQNWWRENEVTLRQ